MRDVYCYKCLVRPELGSAPVERCYATKKEAIEKAVYEYNEKGEPTKVEISEKTQKSRKCKREFRDDVWYAYNISIVLACHFGKADITALEYNESHQILRYAAEVQRGLVTMMPKREICKSVYNVSNTPKAYLVSLNLADTMCHSAASTKSLDALGKACGVPKIELPENTKSEMMNLLKRDPKLYTKYAVNDAVICVEYLRSIYGENKKPPVTMTSGGCKITKERMIEYFKKTDKEFDEADFDKVYCGIEIVNDGLEYDEDKTAFLQETKAVPLNPTVATIHDYASQAYCGGYNLAV